MTTETTCLSSIWETDEVTQRFLAVHGLSLIHIVCNAGTERERM